MVSGRLCVRTIFQLPVSVPEAIFWNSRFLKVVGENASLKAGSKSLLSDLSLDAGKSSSVTSCANYANRWDSDFLLT